ncbi:MAG: damage-inducible protein DinB [Thermoflexibacter sp.]|nr:damage-inducible protein DinB [Thermoflexibacter sp.]
MVDFFKELFEYGHHFNQKLADVIAQREQEIPEKAKLLFSHILNAHHVWNNRILFAENPYGVWDLQATQDLASIDEKNYRHSLLILENVDLANEINYLNSKGLAFKNTVRDILFHLVNHSTHHRGQISTLFRQNGIEPLVMDYIFYKRQ